MIDNSLFSESPVSAEILSEDTPFIDIGIPESLKNAQRPLKAQEAASFRVCVHKACKNLDLDTMSKS